MAVTYLSKQFPSKHPLADREFETDGIDLFIQKFEQLINISQAGQLAMKEVLQTHLQRIERDVAGIPVKLYPFTRKRDSREEPKTSSRVFPGQRCAWPENAIRVGL